MLKINKEEVKNYYKLDLLSELHIVESRISFFENKYNTTLEEFEKNLEETEENFEKWDDLMEWKGYYKSCQQIKDKLREIENENYKLT